MNNSNEKPSGVLDRLSSNKWIAAFCVVIIIFGFYSLWRTISIASEYTAPSASENTSANTLKTGASLVVILISTIFGRLKGAIVSGLIIGSLHMTWLIFSL